jgi:O-methyltransferase
MNNITSPRNILKTMIFGGKEGSKLIKYEIEKTGLPVEIIAFANNDKNLQNTIWFDKPVIHPKEIVSYEYDQIILTTEKIDFIDEIVNQLTSKYNILKDQINTTFALSKLQIMARKNALKNVAELIYSNKISGATAELGVFQGQFAKYINMFFPDRKLYLFDTFDGFNKQDVNRDLELGVGKSILDKSYDFSNTGEELVLKQMKYRENCIIKKGYFPGTAENIDEKFCFVSLDADLYQPMFAGLKYFYPRLEKGGYIFIHDYFSDVFSGTKKAVLEYKKIEEIHCVPLGDDYSIAIVKM